MKNCEDEHAFGLVGRASQSSVGEFGVERKNKRPITRFGAPFIKSPQRHYTTKLRQSKDPCRRQVYKRLTAPWWCVAAGQGREEWDASPCSDDGRGLKRTRQCQRAGHSHRSVRLAEGTHLLCVLTSLYWLLVTALDPAQRRRDTKIGTRIVWRHIFFFCLPNMTPTSHMFPRSFLLAS